MERKSRLMCKSVEVCEGPLNYYINPPISASARIEFKQSSDKSRSSHKEFGRQLPNQCTLILFRSISLRL